MSIPCPDEILPHRPPFLFVDEITELDPGTKAVGTWTLTGEEAFFSGHFPGRPTLPGVLMCEAIAQVGAFALLSDERFAGKLPLFGGLDSARFRRQVGLVTHLNSRSTWVGCRHEPARGAVRRPSTASSP